MIYFHLNLFLSFDSSLAEMESVSEDIFCHYTNPCSGQGWSRILSSKHVHQCELLSMCVVLSARVSHNRHSFLSLPTPQLDNKSSSTLKHVERSPGPVETKHRDRFLFIKKRKKEMRLDPKHFGWFGVPYLLFTAIPLGRSQTEQLRVSLFLVSVYKAKCEYGCKKNWTIIRC